MTRRNRTTAPRRGPAWQAAGILLLVALTTLSCKKVALTAPSGSSIQLFTSRTTAGLNSTVTITAVVMEAGGTPVHDGTSVSFFSTLGTMNPAAAVTTNGQAAAQLVTDTQSGTAEITAVSGTAKLASTVKVTVGAVAVGRVDLSANPSSLPSTGGTADLTALVSDTSGNRLQGVPVTFTTNAGSLDRNGVATDASGQATARLTTQVTASVTAAVAGGTSGSVTSTAQTVTVRSAPLASFGTVTLTGKTALITYSATASSGGAAISSVGMSFGDGSAVSNLSSGSSQSITHLYSTLGTFTLVLTVTDAAGETVTATTIIVVQ